MKTKLQFVFTIVAILFINQIGYSQENFPSLTNSKTEIPAPDHVKNSNSLYAQMSNPVDFGTNSQMYPDFPTYTCQGADDFVVPLRQTWFIDEVVVMGFFQPSGGGPVAQANLYFYEHNPATNSPGQLVFSKLLMPVTVSPNGILSLTLLEPLVLTNGHYWLSVQPVMSYNPSGQWFWRRQSAPTIRREFHWQNPGGGFGLPNTLSWQMASQINFGNNSTDYNLSFALNGTYTQNPLPIDFTINIPSGWSGISSHIVPSDLDIETLLQPIAGNLIYLYNDDGVYWPGEDINTLENWNPDAGYLVKMTSEATLTFTGEPNPQRTVTLTSGLNILHVPVECEVSTSEIFNQLGGSLIYIQGIATTKVFLPQYGVDYLQQLLPGRAYYIKTSSNVVIQFPECDFIAE